MNSGCRQRRRGGTALALVGLSMLLLSVFGVGSAAAKAPPGIFWGGQIGDQLTGEAAPWDLGAVEKFAAKTNKKPSLLSFSTPWADCQQGPCEFYSFPTTPLNNALAYGAVPMLNWSSEGSLGKSSEPKFKLKRIINGSYDNYISYFAEEAAKWGHPFFLRFNWEMNGFWFPWSDEANGNKRGEFVAAWRHVHRIFDAEGADNVSWTWCPNVDFTRKLQPLNQVYPGDAFVDWTCLDGFNWGKTDNSKGWMSFTEVFSQTYKRVLKIAPGKPMMIGEVASDNRGGSKASWIRDMLNVVPKKFKKVRGLVWFETEDQEMHWGLSEPKGAAKAFAAGIRKKVYRPNLFGVDALAPGPIAPPSL